MFAGGDWCGLQWQPWAACPVSSRLPRLCLRSHHSNHSSPPPAASCPPAPQRALALLSRRGAYRSPAAQWLKTLHLFAPGPRSVRFALLPEEEQAALAGSLAGPRGGAPLDSVQLRSRHWLIRDAQGAVESEVRVCTWLGKLQSSCMWVCHWLIRDARGAVESEVRAATLCVLCCQLDEQ